jgi:hypothetical protein
LTENIDGAKVSSGMDRIFDGTSPRTLIDRAEGSMFLWTVAASLFTILTVALPVLVWPRLGTVTVVPVQTLMVLKTTSQTRGPD